MVRGPFTITDPDVSTYSTPGIVTPRVLIVSSVCTFSRLDHVVPCTIGDNPLTIPD